MAEQLKARELNNAQPKPRLGDILTTEQLTNKLKDAITKNMASGFKIDWKSAMNLIDAGADIEALNFFSRTALMVAAAEGEVKVCKFLIEKGAKIDARDKRYWETPLIQAAQCGKNNVCRLLIEKGADVNAANHGGWTALMYAASANDVVTCHLLLKSGADEGIRNVAKNRAMDIAKSQKSMDAFYFLGSWKLRKSIGFRTARRFIASFRECIRNN